MICISVMKTPSIVVLIVSIIAVTCSTRLDAQSPPPKFKDKASQQRYEQARADAIRYEAERARQEAIAKELERQDKKFKPIREGSINAFGKVAGSAAPKGTGPIVGPIARETMRSAIDDFTNDPAYEARKRAAQEQQAREYQAYQERQRQAYLEFQRRQAEALQRQREAAARAYQSMQRAYNQQAQQFQQRYPQPQPRYEWRMINGRLVQVRVQ
jgi:hypothetical protein